jgi:AraC family transcriptional regulator, regulatory protein of adaptative response / DNA-3-methyladenine glycosylase II
VIEDFERCYGAVNSRDPRFDGWFFTAVTSTRIYCRPSCPATTPKRENVRFYPTAAAAQQSGFRACLRCRPDAAPGSPEWLGRADVAARAVKLILHGIVDTEGVSGLARRLSYGERQLHRVLLAEVGTGALALARAQRAQTARLLLETTGLPVSHVAFAAGFSSVRQFNETVREIFARTPTELRRAASKRSSTHKSSDAASAVAPAQSISLRLAYREPFAARTLFEFLGARAIPGVEVVEPGTDETATYSRSLNLPNGSGTVALSPDDGFVRAVFALEDLRDLTTAVARCRHLCNLDADPVAVDEALSKDPLLRRLVKRLPGIRVPGAADGFELATRAVIGQQVSVSGARTIAGRLATAAGSPLGDPSPGLTHTFPTAAALVELGARSPESFPMPTGRRRALIALAEAVAGGRVRIDVGTHPADLDAQLLAIPGIGPWTSAYIVMRALGDPDTFMPTDLGVRKAAAALGLPDDTPSLTDRSQRWRPWRSYALCHMWSAPLPAVTPGDHKLGDHKIADHNVGLASSTEPKRVTKDSKRVTKDSKRVSKGESAA